MALWRIDHAVPGGYWSQRDKRGQRTGVRYTSQVNLWRITQSLTLLRLNVLQKQRGEYKMSAHIYQMPQTGWSGQVWTIDQSSHSQGFYKYGPVLITTDPLHQGLLRHNRFRANTAWQWHGFDKTHWLVQHYGCQTNCLEKSNHNKHIFSDNYSKSKQG